MSREQQQQLQATQHRQANMQGGEERGKPGDNEQDPQTNVNKKKRRIRQNINIYFKIFAITIQNTVKCKKNFKNRYI